MKEKEISTVKIVKDYRFLEKFAIVKPKKTGIKVKILCNCLAPM